MIRSSRLAWTAALALVLAAGPAAGPAFAIKQFADEFKAVYVKEGTPLAAAVETAKCNVCHVGKNKKDRNAYGEELAKLLDKKTDKEDKAKIKQALEAVAKLPSKEAGKTFGDLIAAGQLPGGPAE
jgi:cytochrome c2